MSVSLAQRVRQLDSRVLFLLFAPLVIAALCAPAAAEEGSVRLVTTELRSNDACDTKMVESEKEEFPICFRGPPKTWVELADLSDTVDLDVKFEFDSARLTPEAQGVLSELAVTMNDPTYIDVPFRLEGHTDAVGTDAYNLGLSDRRAQSVHDYLISQGVADWRLSSVGKGESELLDPANPTSGVNRRVRVINLETNPMS